MMIILLVLLFIMKLLVLMVMLMLMVMVMVMPIDLINNIIRTAGYLLVSQYENGFTN